MLLKWLESALAMRRGLHIVDWIFNMAGFPPVALPLPCAVAILVAFPLFLDALPHSTAQSCFLNAHNAVRAGVGVRPLSWRADLAAYARRYAELRRADCDLLHSAGPYGENIFEGSGGYSAVADWAAEWQHYHYAENRCDAGWECGHYTQMVWADSLFVGCAQVTCDCGDVFVICNYDPPGNVDGQRPY